MVFVLVGASPAAPDGTARRGICRETNAPMHNERPAHCTRKQSLCTGKATGLYKLECSICKKSDAFLVKTLVGLSLLFHLVYSPKHINRPSIVDRNNLPLAPAIPSQAGKVPSSSSCSTFPLSQFTHNNRPLNMPSKA